jgi:hypothetical protein
MARPQRPLGEAAAIHAAAAEYSEHNSVQCVAGMIANRVVADLFRFIDEDPFLAKLSVLETLYHDSPVDRLVRCPEINTAKEVLDRRATRYRARGCQQLAEGAWVREQREIADEVRALLTRRYADALRPK